MTNSLTEQPDDKLWADENSLVRFQSHIKLKMEMIMLAKWLAHYRSLWDLLNKSIMLVEHKIFQCYFPLAHRILPPTCRLPGSFLIHETQFVVYSVSVNYENRHSQGWKENSFSFDVLPLTEQFFLGKLTFSSS